MKKVRLACCFLLLAGGIHAMTENTSEQKIPAGGALLEAVINGEDTTFIADLQDIYVFPRRDFSSKKEEQFYWRTVRDVKKTLPLAKIVGQELARTNKVLAELPNDAERKKYMNQYGKELFSQYEPMLKKMTMSQGKMLIKLIDRECQITSYDLIKIYRGGFTAFFWQGFARIFGANLKSEYNPVNEDKAIERVIQLVEAGQL